jgi:hypothetical protein
MWRRGLCVASFFGATAISFYGAGCSSSSSTPVTAVDGGGAPDTSPVGRDSSEGSDAYVLPKVCKAPSSLSFTPVLHAQPMAGLCTPDIFNSLFAACYDQATQSAAACNDAQQLYPGSMACFTQCMATEFTPPTATTASDAWGGVIQRMDQPGIYFVDIGACVAALDKSPEGQKCAKDLEGQLECETLSCAGCTVPASPTMAEVQGYDACEMAAPCNSFMTAEETDCASNYVMGDASNGPAGACLTASVTLGSSTTTAAEASAAIRVVVAAICAPEVLKEGGDGGKDGGDGGS